MYKYDRLWLTLGVVISVATFFIDLLTPRGVAAGVFPHFVAIGLSAWSSARFAPYALAGLASVFTLTGFALTAGGSAEIVMINRAFLVASYWLVAFLVHQKQLADWKLARGHAGLEQAVEERTRDLADSESRLRLVTERLPALVAYVDSEERYRFINRYYEQVLGIAEDRTFGRHIREVLGEEAYEIVKPNIERVLAGETVRCSISLPVGNRERDFRVTYVPDPDPEGSIAGFVLLALDVTEELELQRKLEQSQKLEAIGQLSGGIAHDFNNLLGVIIGNLELASTGADAGIRRYLDAAEAAADRGASLVQRLLIFARRHPLRPSVIDLNAVIGSMKDLLDRSLGQQVEIDFIGAGELWPTLADAHQFEAAILNLALNARDAMPTGGKVTIETRNHQLEAGPASEQIGLPPGDYVVTCVTDDGRGMAAGTMACVFEPFFTTKEPGKGSGLGLPMVYGFARSSGGGVTIYSELGKGTTVCVYLPRTTAAGQVERAEAGEAARPVPGSGETILVVEDDPGLRLVVRGLLKQIDYRVETCADGEQALVRLAEGGIDILLTDLVLASGMNGRQLAAAARARHPGLAVLFMSGDSGKAMPEWEDAISEAELVEKPFHIEQLAGALVRARQRAGRKA